MTMNTEISNILLKQENLKISLEAYATAFENLSIDNYQTSLIPLMSNDVFFQDPFNQVTGREATLNIFAHMFDALCNPEFTVTHTSLQRARPAHRDNQTEFTGFLYWQFEFSQKDAKNRTCFDGISKVEFNEQGLIKSHIDYWDPSEVVYDKVPVLSWLVKKVRQKLSASQ